MLSPASGENPSARRLHQHHVRNARNKERRSTHCTVMDCGSVRCRSLGAGVQRTQPAPCLAMPDATLAKRAPRLEAEAVSVQAENFWRSFGSASRCAQTATGDKYNGKATRPPPEPNPPPAAPLRLRQPAACRPPRCIMVGLTGIGGRVFSGVSGQGTTAGKCTGSRWPASGAVAPRPLPLSLKKHAGR